MNQAYHIKFLKTLLELQLQLSPENIGMRQEPFSLGYMAGFVDSYLQHQNIDNDSRGHAFMGIIFMEVLGIESGIKNFSKFLDLFSEENIELLSGMNAGGNDLNNFVLESQNPPMGWADYLNKVAI